jgi:formylglycine-generating enzyme required for sulfatase activity
MGTSGPLRFPEDGEGPMRTVEVSPFDIAAHTVTNAQFGEFVRRTGSETDAERFNWSFVFSAFVGEEVKRRGPASSGGHALVASNSARVLGPAGGAAEHRVRPPRPPRGACLMERRAGLLSMVLYAFADRGRMGVRRSWWLGPKHLPVGKRTCA